MPLTYLNLGDGPARLFLNARSDPARGYLQGMPLRDLSLDRCSWVTDETLEGLQGLPLECLNLNSCDTRQVTDGGLVHLRGLPLTKLSLAGCLALPMLVWCTCGGSRSRSSALLGVTVSPNPAWHRYTS